MKGLCAVLVVLALAAGAWADGRPIPYIAIDPLSIIVEPDDLFSLDVVIGPDVLGVTGYDLVIDFDETLLDVVNVVKGALPAGSPPSYFWWTDQGTPSSAIVINGALLGHDVDGPGVLAELRFKALAIGVTPIHFESVDLRDLDNNRITVTPVDGQVTIEPGTPVEPTSWSMVKALFL